MKEKSGKRKRETVRAGIRAVCAAGILCMLLLLAGQPAQAADISMVSLNLDDTWVSGEISTSGEVDYYTVTLPSAGWLNVSYQGFSICDSIVRVMDKDLTVSYGERDLRGTSSISPRTTNLSYAFEPGTYVIRIQGDYENIFWETYYTGDYRVKASFTPANNNDIENNNSFQTAMPLQPNQQLNGFLSEGDVDFFQISVPSTRKVKIYYTWYCKDLWSQIWNSDFIKVDGIDFTDASESSPRSYVYEETFTAGNYYIKMSGGPGRYGLRYEICPEDVAVSSLGISGASKMTAGTARTLTAVVSPSNATIQSVTWKSGNTNVAGVDKNGRVTAYRPGVVNITATAADGSNVSTIHQIVVLPKKMAKPQAGNTPKKKMYVSWTRQEGVSGYQIQYGTKKTFRNAKTKSVSYGTSSKVITRLSKKTYYVRIRAFYKQGNKKYYGNWSQTRKVRIRR